MMSESNLGDNTGSVLNDIQQGDFFAASTYFWFLARAVQISLPELLAVALSHSSNLLHLFVSAEQSAANKLVAARNGNPLEMIKVESKQIGLCMCLKS